jgi:hypothetical protein
MKALRKGWDQRFMVWLAYVLTLVVAVAGMYQAVAWAFGHGEGRF